MKEVSHVAAMQVICGVAAQIGDTVADALRGHLSANIRAMLAFDDLRWGARQRVKRLSISTVEVCHP